jgi:DNA polymerase III sliding clamp (beta) subunit (PCNA family)
MINTNRELFLSKLHSVRSGLSKNKDNVDQSTCFIFKDNKIITFNEEVYCSTNSNFGTLLLGAVKAQPLIDILTKMAEEDIELEKKDKELIIHGVNKKCGIQFENQVSEEIDSIWHPSELEWGTLEDDFNGALDVVMSCAQDKDDGQFFISCVHLHPQYIEATDNIQLARYNISIPIKSDCLIRKRSVKNLIGMGVTEISESDNWIHFRNDLDTRFYCRRFVDDYLVLDQLLQDTGTLVNLPQGIGDSVEKASIFTKDNNECGNVLVTIKNGKMGLKGSGALGWYTETKSIDYKGEPISFYISAEILQQINKKGNQCEIVDGRLRIVQGSYTYVTVLTENKVKKPIEALHE